MDADCGVMVVSRRGKLLAATPLAESYLARPLPWCSYLKANGPLAPSFSRHGHPIWEGRTMWFWAGWRLSTT
jgi:hypothetical protein